MAEGESRTRREPAFGAARGSADLRLAPEDRANPPRKSGGQPPRGGERASAKPKAISGGGRADAAARAKGAGAAAHSSGGCSSGA